MTSHKPYHQHHSLTGQQLRSTAFALLAKREYSKADLTKKLMGFGANPDEVMVLIDELVAANYQSDERMAGMVVRSQIRQGRGLARIKQELKKRQIDTLLADDALEEIDWLQQAYQTKIKKFGTDVAKDPKTKAKQIRFLQYRGFAFDVIIKAIQMTEQDYLDEFVEE